MTEQPSYEKLERSLDEIVRVNDFSVARRVLAQTTAAKAEHILWSPYTTRTSLISKSEAIRRTYSKIVKLQCTYVGDQLADILKEEAAARTEAYLSALAFRGCILDADEITIEPSLSVELIPSDLHCEEQLITQTLQKKYGDESPVPSDLA